MHISTQINTVPYLGSKFSILPWLLPLLPRTKSFVELFGGSMVITVNREPSQIETYCSGMPVDKLRPDEN